MTLPGNILLLTATPDQMQSAMAALAEQNVSVQRVEGSYRFLAAFAAAPVEAVVIDMQGLRRADLEMLAIMREINPRVGIIALVDGEQRELAAKTILAGADLYLLKPAEGPELIEALGRLGRKTAGPATAAAPAPAADTAVHSLAMGVADRINNSLTTLSGWLQMLAAERANDAQLAGIIQSMKEEAGNIQEVVRRLLFFAQDLPPRMETVDIARLLRDLGRAHAIRCADRGVEMTTDIAHNMPLVRGDEGQLRMACESFLQEAETSLNGSGRIQLHGHEHDNDVEIIVHDDAPPVPRERLRHIFDPFHPGRRNDGRGPGLWLANRVIETHGGHVEASSTEAEGTRFVIRLPCT